MRHVFLVAAAHRTEGEGDATEDAHRLRGDLRLQTSQVLVARQWSAGSPEVDHILSCEIRTRSSAGLA